MKSGMQMMFESLLGEQGLKAIEECKRVLPAVPQLIDSIKKEWESAKQQLNDIAVTLDVHGEQREDWLAEMQQVRQLCERIATQNNLILGKLESIEMNADPTKTTEIPPTLMAHLSVPENAERFMSLEAVVLSDGSIDMEKVSNGSNRDSNSNT